MQQFSRGVVTNGSLPIKKHAAYGLLKNHRHNWRKFQLVLAGQVANFFSRLSGDSREHQLSTSPELAAPNIFPLRTT